MDTTEDIAGRKRLDELYREIGPQLLAYFLRRHGPYSVAEDLLQETFAAALRRPAQMANMPSPRAFLFVVARNLSINVYRRSKHEVTIPLDLPAPIPEAVDSRVEEMRVAIAKLNFDSREVLQLRLDQELSYEEIAAVLEIPVGTVRSRLHHAVKTLQQSMNPGGRNKKEYNYES